LITNLSTPQHLHEQFRELEDEPEKKKVKLSPEVQAYAGEHLEAVQEKLIAGEPVYQSDLDFMDEVRLWVVMPEEWREKYPTIEAMKSVDDVQEVHKEAKKRHISMRQWIALLHVAEYMMGPDEAWIDKTFMFPGGGKIKREGDLHLSFCVGLTALPEGLEVRGGLYLTDCTGLTALPEGLEVGGSLDLKGCRGLTSLPEDLSVGRDLHLDKKSKWKIKRMAKKLKKEGKIKGEIKYV